MKTSSFAKAVAGATKCTAPKSQYVEVILIATHSGEAGVAEIFRLLRPQIQSPTWTVVFKALMVVHLMIREGQEDATLQYLSDAPQRHIATNGYSGIHLQKQNVDDYSNYLIRRAAAYKSAGVDYVRSGTHRLKGLTIDKGLLRETELVQKQIGDLVKCQFLTSPELVNDITLAAYKLLFSDLLALFAAMNEGTSRILENFLSLSKPDAERALGIYRKFVKQTDKAASFFEASQMHSAFLRLSVPTLRHVPISLADSLEAHLNDPDFEENRKRYLQQQEAQKAGKSYVGIPIKNKLAEEMQKPQPKTTSTPAAASAPAPAPVQSSFDLLTLDDDKPTSIPPTTAGFPGIAAPMPTGFGASGMGQMVGTMPPMMGMMPPTMGPNGLIPNQTGMPMVSGMGMSGIPGMAGSTPVSLPSFPGSESAFSPNFAPLGSLQGNATLAGMSLLPQQTGQVAGLNSGLGTGMTSGPGMPGYFAGANNPGAFTQTGRGGFGSGTATPLGSGNFSLSVPDPLVPQSTNPFRKSVMPLAASQNQQQQQQQQQQQSTGGPAAPSQIPARTGTNPFAKPTGGTFSPNPMAMGAQSTGSTNPFARAKGVGMGGAGLGSQQQQHQQQPPLQQPQLQQLQQQPMFPAFTGAAGATSGAGAGGTNPFRQHFSPSPSM